MSLQFQNLRFDNRFVRDLPGDPEQQNFRRQVYGACFSPVQPTAVSNPKLIAFFHEVAEQIGLSSAECQTQAFAEVFAGNQILPKMQPYAACYGGHQFGNWAGQLGDGRAITLGEVLNENSERWVLQLKGAGPTPYSRMGDGRAVLRSSIREFLCSEAMYHLGIPTTRALSLVTTGDDIMRDMFYNGNLRAEPGAVVCRVSPSFIRFGNFEIFASRDDVSTLQHFTDFCMTRDFPHLKSQGKQRYVDMFAEVCRSTAELIALWMSVGFVHGVMNTDNMSILGLTIDYGPYGWLDHFDPSWTPNTTDAMNRRYCYGNQPSIAMWNLAKLAGALYPLIEEIEPLQQTLEEYSHHFTVEHSQRKLAKLGIVQGMPDDAELLNELDDLLVSTEVDMTLFYRGLTGLRIDNDDFSAAQCMTTIEGSLYKPADLEPAVEKKFEAWLQRYWTRLRRQGVADGERHQQMNTVNPKYIFRNYIAQLAIDAAEQGDNSIIHEVMQVIRNPYAEQIEHEKYSKKRPEWARNRPGCSTLSCSS